MKKKRPDLDATTRVRVALSKVFFWGRKATAILRGQRRKFFVGLAEKR